MNRASGAVPALRYRSVTFAYPNRAAALRDVSVDIEAGEVVVVAGSSGSGKSTFLRAANGLVPHVSGGRLAGEVEVFGRSTRRHPPRKLADLVGFVHQDPEAQFVVDQVEADIAFALENLDVEPSAMRRRVEEILDALDVAHLRHRSPGTLSGGERQRCAIAGAMVASPALLVLDEPTSQLDPQGAEDVLAAVARLNADLGTTILMSEHRLERAAPLADRAIVLAGGGIIGDGPPGRVLATYAGAPAVTHLGRLLGWNPAPMTVRDARVHLRASSPELSPAPARRRSASSGEELIRALGLDVALGSRPVLRRVDVEVRAGEVLAVLGRNGAGKTTLLRALAGLADATGGRIVRTGSAGYVPQDPDALLLGPTVRRDVEQTMRLLRRGRRRSDWKDDVERWLVALGLDALADRHPRDLAAGERQRVAIASIAVGGADVLLLDEPTRGMDAASKTMLERAISVHAQGGGAVVLATHDVELAARVATRALVLADGEVVADGDARTVLSGSLFAPQVLRVLPPYLTVAEVAAALAGSGAAGHKGTESRT